MSRRPLVSALNPTPEELLVDARGRPYFLWDEETTLDEFVLSLRSPDPDIRAYRVAKLMRQAKPDDALSFLSLQEIRDIYPRTARYLGKSKPFWDWLLEAWKERQADDR